MTVLSVQRPMTVLSVLRPKTVLSVLEPKDQNHENKIKVTGIYDPKQNVNNSNLAQNIELQINTVLFCKLCVKIN